VLLRIGDGTGGEGGRMLMIGIHHCFRSGSETRSTSDGEGWATWLLLLLLRFFDR